MRSLERETPEELPRRAGNAPWRSPEGAFIIIGQISTFYYFFHLIVVIPLIGILERPRPIPESISASVTK